MKNARAEAVENLSTWRRRKTEEKKRKEQKKKLE